MVFCVGDQLAPLTLEEFIADGPLPITAEAEITRDFLAAEIVKKRTLRRIPLASSS